MPEPGSTRFETVFLQEMAQAIFHRLGVPEAECAIVVDTLMDASLSGYDGHGLLRIPMYAAGIRNGAMVPGAAMERLSETPASVHLDARHALGPVSATAAVELAVDMAKAVGVGCVSVVHGNDIARLGGYVQAPAEAGLIVLLMVNDAGGNPCVVPWGGTAPFLSTNPIAAGIPWRPGQPIVVDMSTSIVAMGQLKMRAGHGESAPDGWLIDANGEAVFDPSAVLSLPRTAALLPLGGRDGGGYKGFALSLIVDLLAGGLSGAGCSTGAETGRDENGLFVLAIDPDMFVSRERFARSVEELVAGIKASPRAPGVDAIRIPGERACAERQRRTRDGIPLDDFTRAAIGRVLTELELAERYPL